VAGSIVFGVGLALFLLFVFLRDRRNRRPAPPALRIDTTGDARRWPPTPKPAVAQEIEREVQRAQEAAAGISQRHGSLDAAQNDALFRLTVERVVGRRNAAEIAAGLADAGDPVTAALGLTALWRCRSLPPRVTDWAIAKLATCDRVLEPFVYRLLVRHATHPVIASALSKIDEGIAHDSLAEFIQNRQQAGEAVTEETFRGRVPFRCIPQIETLVSENAAMLGNDFCAAFAKWAATAPETLPTAPTEIPQPGFALGEEQLAFLRSFARFRPMPVEARDVVLVGRRAEIAEQIRRALTEQPRRSVLLVGEHGVGKTALARVALSQIPELQPVFEASAAETYAGCVYVGELESRIAAVVEVVAGTPAVWMFPNLEEAIYLGQHSRSRQGMLDALLPPITGRQLTLIAETTPTGYERLLRERPGALAAFVTVRVRPLDAAEAIQVGLQAAAARNVTIDDESLGEAYELTRQFMVGSAAPGSLVRLVNDTANDVLDAGRAAIEPGDFLRRVSANSGLPLAMLDRHTPLDLERVRAFFEERILGQPEAVQAVVERIALAKAGLTDPTRPFGVLFFVGPTGTGKTEIAKALAEFMFGSPERLVRVDMSEYQTPAAFERLLAAGAQGSTLLTTIRKDPFAVVLLDEFEKAASPVWDLFLQVFDDGRLTDSDGETVDFRRTVLIMTSNVGSSLATKRSIGFGSSADGRFDPSRFEEALRLSFRPEFLNRIDRIVVFSPFERSQMRALLDKELAEALGRRGFRMRPWAVELDESAYEFLIDEGFSPSLGARPLKRAVERYFLAPVAQAIVGEHVPEGDQFLFVTAAADKLDVRFIDPDAPSPAELTIAPKLEPGSGPSRQDLRALARSPDGDQATVAFLLHEQARIDERMRALDVAGKKAAALTAMSEQAFWESSDRFPTLARAEYLDRLEAAHTTAVRLAARLRRPRAGDHASARELVELLALRLYVLDRTLDGIVDGAPNDVFLRLRAWTDEEDASAFLDRLTMMYERWADRRGMRVRTLKSTARERYLAVTGLGCGAILPPENGLHVAQQGRDRDTGTEGARVAVHVSVAPWPAGPESGAPDLLRRAEAAIAAILEQPELVRSYRGEPSPLVRDRVRRYRTGRLKDVLDGDFDLFGLPRLDLPGRAL
jgi:ATP-dependent Clp protease ATP-binding subunit ClpC